MPRINEPAGKTISNLPRQSDASDDRGLADLPNDLCAISLSSDEIPAMRTDEMGLNGCEDRDDRKSHHVSPCL
jgi:hypothetical protein